MLDVELELEEYGNVTVEYTYDPGEPDEYYDSRGNPGTPGYPASVDIYHVWATFKDRTGKDCEVDLLPVIDTDVFYDEVMSNHEQ